jgi:pimeloyl-ACP methyl ester carboxylesterase
MLFPAHVADADSKGIRLIGHDRAGYGGSSPQTGRRIVDEAEDVAAIANELGIERFAVWGFSGGGAPSLACAARLPRRVVAAASLAGAAPYGAEGLDWFSGMGELNASDFRLLLSDRPRWEEKVRRDGHDMRQASPSELPAMLASILSEADRSVLTPGLARFLVQQARDGLKQQMEGLRDDGLSQVSPWGFELSSVRVPVQVWHGAHDRAVPFAHGEWLTRHVPDAEGRLLSNEGHVSLFVRRIPEVHQWLATRF